MKKARIIGTVSICVLVLASLAACVQEDEFAELSIALPRAAGDGSNINFELASTTLPTHDKLMVFEVENPVVTTESVKEVGEALGFKGSAGSIDRGTKIAMLDESEGMVRQFAVWIDSGAVEYGIVEPDMLYPDTPPTLPSDEEAKRIAIEFLEQMGLLPEDAPTTQAEVIIGGTYSVAVKGSGEKVEEYPTHLIVSIRRVIEGLPVVGPGARLGVRIGDEGEVIRLFEVWRDVKPHKELDVKSPAQAFNDLESGKGSYMAPPDCAEVVIEKVSLAYWMEAADNIQEHVLPVYIFEGDCFNENGEYMDPFEGYCEALKKS